MAQNRSSSVLLTFEADRAAWSSAAWTPLTVPDEAAPDATRILGWCKSSIPYLPSQQRPLPLQTLDVWVPARNATSSTAPPEPSSLPVPSCEDQEKVLVWIVYIHGGAWRDPTIEADSFGPAAKELLKRFTPATSRSSSKNVLAGLASLNYRLSPHPNHPAPDRPDRNVRHPEHLRDVLTGLSFLQRVIFSSTPTENIEFILTGHSCGATLSFQSIMSPLTRFSLPPNLSLCKKPMAIVGFNGLYDLAGFIHKPPKGWEGHVPPYEEFTRGAFGDDERVWRAVCPASAEGDWLGEWLEEKKGAKVVLGISKQDSLVPREQMVVMRECLEREKEKGRGVEVRVVEGDWGDHDEVWQSGWGMAGLLGDVVEEL